MDVGLDFGGGGYSLQGQLDKIDYDMTKAGFPKSAIFLALHNECKKRQAKELAEHHFMQYKNHRDMEDKQKLKAEQAGMNYAASLVPKYFPPESAKKNSDAFIESCERYLPCPENAKMMTDHMISNGVAPTVEGFYHTFWILYNGGNLIRHDWDAPTNGVIKKKPPVAFSGYDVSPDLYNQEAQKAQQQQVAASMMGMLGAAGAGALGGIGGSAGLVGDKFYGKGLVELIKGQEPSSSIESQQTVLNTMKQQSGGSVWGGGSDKAPPPAPKPKQVDSVPDHGGARRFRHEDD